MRSRLAVSKDPAEERKRVKAEDADKAVFADVFSKWLDETAPRLPPDYAHLKRRRIEVDVPPFLGQRVFAEIEPPDILQVLRRIESRGVKETAHRIHQTLGEVETSARY